MTRDREVNLGNLNDVTVDDHGDAGRRPSSAGNNKPSGKGAGKPPKAPKTPPPASHGGSGGWMIACLVLVVLIAVMGVWFQKQMTVLQAQMDERISESSQELGNLQSRLSATDESLNQSSGKLLDTVRTHGKKLEENNTEIRKLWDLSNKRNRADIAEQSKKLTALSSTISEVKKAQAGVDGKLQGINKDTAALKKQVDSAVTAVNKSSEQWQTRISQMQTQVDVLAENINQLESQQQSLKNGLAKVEKGQADLAALKDRLDETEAAIAAFDSYRLQVNSRLDTLEGR
jgi:chromosome segregation ATPase